MLSPQSGVWKTEETGTSTRLRRDVEALAGFGPRAADDVLALRRTIDHVAAELSAAGCTVAVHRFGPGAGDVNVIAECAGTDPTASFLEVGAHYDTVPGSPGADDNASGVAGVLELARLRSGRPTRGGLRLCLFGGEERSMLGSKAHVQRLLTEDLRSDGLIALEMIGCRRRGPDSQRSPLRLPLVFSPPRSGDFVAAVANFASRRLATRFVRAARAAVPALPVFAVRLLGGFLKHAAKSDHVSYWRANRPGLMLTDTAHFRNPHYHKPGDRPDTLDFAFMSDVVWGLEAMVDRWAR